MAAGVVLPLAAGAASGHLEYGAFASLGALPAGLASFQGVTRTSVAAGRGGRPVAGRAADRGSLPPGTGPRWTARTVQANLSAASEAGRHALRLAVTAGPAATARVSETAIGSGLALAAYLLWPSWHSRTARDKFAPLVEAHGRYTAALLRALAHPGGGTAAKLDSLQAAARQARLDAEASAARLAREPAQSPLPPAVAQDLVAAVRRLAHAELALHACVSSARDTIGTAGAK